jgi:hypothetical protein
MDHNLTGSCEHNNARRVTIQNTVGLLVDEQTPALNLTTDCERAERLVGHVSDVWISTGAEREAALLRLIADAQAWLELIVAEKAR